MRTSPGLGVLRGKLSCLLGRVAAVFFPQPLEAMGLIGPDWLWGLGAAFRVPLLGIPGLIVLPFAEMSMFILSLFVSKGI